MSIQQIAASIFTEETLNRSLVVRLKKDERKGVQALVQKYERRQKQLKALEDMHRSMTVYENELFQRGLRYIAGLDEVGRGPIAGPVVAAAVVLPPSFKLLGLTDSKQLSKQKREAFYEVIIAEAITYAVEIIPALEVDALNVYQASMAAMVRAVDRLTLPIEHLLVDALTLPVDVPQTSLVKGDQKSVSIAASSVVAKVVRDRYMEQLEATYPDYGFSKHVGYGTKEHLQAIKELGITPEHRRSFEPVKSLLKT